MTAKTLTGEIRVGTERQSPLEYVLALFRAYRKWRSAKKSIEQLQMMDDHMLKDIGIPRGEIRYIVMTGGKKR